MKERIKNILNYKKPAFWVVVISIVACIAAALCFLTNPTEDKNTISAEDNKDSEFAFGTEVNKIGEASFVTYVKNDPTADSMLYWSGLTMNEDGTFTFSPSVISSYIGIGTWAKDGDYVIFSDTGMGDVRKEVFRYSDGKLYYVADKSASNSMWGLNDGAEYILQTEGYFSEKDVY